MQPPLISNPPRRKRRVFTIKKTKEDIAFQEGLQMAHEMLPERMVIYPQNISYGYEPAMFIVPHSEAAMHYGIAGGQIKALGFKERNWLCVGVKMPGPKGIYKSVCDKASWLTQHELQRRLKSFNFWKGDE